MSALLSSDTRPEGSPYFCGGRILSALRDKPEGVSLLQLYHEVKTNDEMGSAAFLMGLEWLFLLDLLVIDDEGRVVSCS